MLFEKQKYQEDCVNNIVSVLDDVDFYKNRFDNLEEIVKKHYQKNAYNHFITSNKSRLDVLMETGTGKTFTYIKTIFELNKKFGKNKFIVIVPRTAIKLGVIQNIKLTDEFFFGEYGKHLNVIEYPKDGISKIKNQFLKDDSISVLVLTNSSFNSDKNNINKTEEDLFQNGSIWNAISSINPVVIMDEPHLLKGGKTAEYIEKLNALFIRFGATYPTDEEHKLSNVVYSLDSVSSFNHYLVKKIRVNTIIFDNEEGGIKVSDIDVRKKKFSISYSLNQQVFSKDIYLNQDIGERTGLTSLLGVTATKISAKKVYLSNKSNKKVLEAYNLLYPEIRKMIEQTIKKHFEKEEKLFKKGIKTLSLFFIPNVEDFRGDNPKVKKIFEEEYRKIRDKYYSSTKNEKYKLYLNKDIKDGKLQVHNGYFSGDKGNADDKIAKGVDTILNDKENLLSFKEPLRFIFSVWALQEGWDNPNIFNICKLSSTDKDTSRRQQVGRGLRIAVNQEGKRLTYKYLDEIEDSFYNINTLDMFVSSKEMDFIGNIQKEILQASFSIIGDFLTTELLKEKGLNDREILKLLNTLEDSSIIKFNETSEQYEIKSPILEFINHNREKLSFFDDKRLEDIKKIFEDNKELVQDGNRVSKKVKIRENKLEEFKELWETINKKSKIVYKNIQEDTIIEAISKKFDSENIDKLEMKIEEKEYNSQKDEIIKKQVTSIGSVNFFENREFSSFVYSFINDNDLKLPLSFVLKLLNKIDNQKIKNNPKKAEQLLKRFIKDSIFDSLLQKIDYNFNNEIKITSLQDENTGEYLKEVKYSALGRYFDDSKAPDNLLYDTIVYDSNIEKIIQKDDPKKIGEDTITVFAKLPKISIPTPYKTYNPDFAYLIKKPTGKQLFLVVESKGYEKQQDIPEDENKKIKYAKVFFNKLQKELPNIQIEYQTRINKQNLSSILSNIEMNK